MIERDPLERPEPRETPPPTWNPVPREVGRPPIPANPGPSPNPGGVPRPQEPREPPDTQQTPPETRPPIPANPGPDPNPAFPGPPVPGPNPGTPNNPPEDGIGQAIQALILSMIGGKQSGGGGVAQPQYAPVPAAAPAMAGLPKLLLIAGLGLGAWWLFSHAKKRQQEAK